MGERYAAGLAWADGVEREPGAHCEAVRLAVARQRRDLADPPAGCRFAVERAERTIRFVERLPLVKGRRHAGGRLALAPWQIWWLGTLFGWVDADGLRRFTEAQLWLPKKNGKSSLAAAVALYLLVADSEEAPEVYTAATKMDQARIVADIAHKMSRRSDGLRGAFNLKLTGNSSARAPHIHCGRNDGVLRPLARDQSGTQDGLDVSGAVVDEIHAHQNRDIYDLLTQGTASRAQPLVLITSTAGFDGAGIGRQRQDALLDVLRRDKSNDALFGAVWTIDDEDDEGDGWREENAWAKANPNLGVSVTWRSLRSLYVDAKNTGSETTFRVKRLNRWASGSRAWMDMAKWRRCARPGLAPTGRCWAGVQLAPGAEPSVACAMWLDGERWSSAFRVWLPERGRAAHAAYEQWIAAGWVVETPGARVNVEAVAAWLRGLDGLAAVCLDPRTSGPIGSVWEETHGLFCVEVPATAAKLSYPLRRWRAAVESGDYGHDGNPCVEWMVGNVVEVVRGDGALSAVAAGDRIDAARAQLLAAAVALGWREPEPGRFLAIG